MGVPPAAPEFARLLLGIRAAKGLTVAEHQAACLLGRGCSPDQIEVLTGITPGRLALLGESPEFADKVSRQRFAWANEEIARLQRVTTNLVPATVSQAVALWRVVENVLEKRYQLDRARLELQIRLRESMQRTTEQAETRPALPDVTVEVEDVELEAEAAEAVGEWEAWEGEAVGEVDEEELEPALP
jgi:hypothetical protein